MACPEQGQGDKGRNLPARKERFQAPCSFHSSGEWEIRGTMKH